MPVRIPAWQAGTPALLPHADQRLIARKRADLNAERQVARYVRRLEVYLHQPDRAGRQAREANGSGYAPQHGRGGESFPGKRRLGSGRSTRHRVVQGPGADQVRREITARGRAVTRAVDAVIL